MIIIGGGLAGVSAAAHAAAITPALPITVIERAHDVGGRMATHTLREGPAAGRRIDMGAAYFTVTRDDFAAVASTWYEQGLVRPWTETFAVANEVELLGSTSGPMRLAATQGMRSVVQFERSKLPNSVQVHTDSTIMAIIRKHGQWCAITEPDQDRAMRHWSADLCALCLPGPQATRLLPHGPVGISKAATAERYQPMITVVASFAKRTWDAFSAAFVNGSGPLSLIVDDGDRRGDLAPVLVGYSTVNFAHEALEQETAREAAVTSLLQAMRTILRIKAEPVAIHQKFWRFARPSPSAVGKGEGRFVLSPAGIGLASDGFAANPRVETAWAAGTSLAHALVTQTVLTAN